MKSLKRISADNFVLFLLFCLSNCYASNNEMFEDLSSPGYDEQIAYNALFFSKAAYCDPDHLKNWDCGFPCTYHSSMQNIQVYSNNSLDTLGFTGYNPITNRIIASFRGSANIENWIQNLDFIKTPFPNPRCAVVGDCEIHEGFWRSYSSLVYLVTSDLLNLIKLYPSSSHILFTGHSMGGSVAFLAAVQMAALLGDSSTLPFSSSSKVREGLFTNKTEILDESEDKVDIMVNELINNTFRIPIYAYTFGAPRIGNEYFARWASSLNFEHYRVTHHKDIVPHLPPESFGFRHSAHEIFYSLEGDANGPGNYTICKDNADVEDNNCSDNLIIPSVSDHLKYLNFSTGCKDN